MVPDTPIQRQVVLASLLTGHYDVNRSTTLPSGDFSLVQDWADSLRAVGLQGILFHNGFSPAQVAQHTSAHLVFVRVQADPAYNPNVSRYFFYRDFLQQQGEHLLDVAATDVSDVEVLRHPFDDGQFHAHPAAIFCGDEPKTLDDPWMHAHAAHFRRQIRGFAAYERAFAQSPLLNCGVILGKAAPMLTLFQQLCDFHHTYNRHNPSAYTGDMGAFNYLLRTRWAGQVIHGPPVNTVFKAYETERKDVWFRHK